MKRFLPILFLLCALGAQATSYTNVVFNLTNFAGDSTLQYGRKVLVTALSYSNSANAFVPKDPRMFTTGAQGDAVAGGFVVTNMLSGTYTLAIQSPPALTSFKLGIPDWDGTGSGTLIATTALITTTNIPDYQTTAYSRAASDARYALIGSGATVAMLNNASNAIAWRAVTNFGAGTNVTLSDSSTPGTNAFYFRNGTAADGNYFFTRSESGVRIFTNGNGYAAGYDAAQAVQDLISVFPNTNGAVSTWIALYATTDTGGKSNWFEGDGIQQFPVETGDAYTSPLLLSGWGAFYPSLIVAGRLEGSGATLTNINGAFLQNATVTGAAFVNGVATNILGNIGTAGNVQATNLFGNGGGIIGRPPGGEMIWKNCPLPLIVVTTYNLDPVNPGSNPSDPKLFGPRELTITNIIRYWKLKGAIAPLNAHGVKPYLHLDVGALWPSRDVNGLIWWNTNKIPDGIPFIANYCHTNGFMLGISIYYSDTAHAYSGGLYDPVMTKETARLDMNQVKSWGVDVIRQSDGPQNTSANYQMEEARVSADAVSYPNGNPATQTNRTGLIIDAATSDTPAEGIGYFYNGRWTDQGVGTGAWPLRSMYQLRTAFNGDGTATGVPAIAQMSGKGHTMGYNLFNEISADVAGIDSIRTPYSAITIHPQELNFWGTNWSATLLQHFTNDTWLSVMFDPLVLPGAVIYDNGASSTAEFARPLTNGNINVLLRNDGASSSNMVVTFSQVHNPPEWAPLGSAIAQWGIPANAVVRVDHVFGNGGTATNIGTFSGSVTQTVAASTSELLLLTTQYVPAIANIATNTIGPLAYDSSTGAYTNGAGTTVLSAGLVNGSAVSGTVPLAAAALAVDGSGITGQYIASPVSAESPIAGGFLTTNGNKIIPSHNASALTNLSAANLTGSIADARLSANVPLLNSANTYTASNHIPGAFEGSGILLTNLNASQLATGLIPKAQAGSVTNTTDTKVIGAAPAIGDTWQYDGLNWTNRPIQGYVIDLFDTGNNSMSANTTYYYGKMSARVINTTYGIAQIDVPKAGTIKRVQYKTDTSGTVGSGEVVNFYIEINNATDVFNWAFAMTASFTNNVVTGSQAVVAGDTIVLKVATPATWSTPAAAVRLAAQVYIE